MKKKKKHKKGQNIFRETNLSESMMVLIRWAIVITVQSLNWVLMAPCMKSSVSRSIAAVASSRTRIFVRLNSALAKHTSCLWPTLKLEKRSRTKGKKKKKRDNDVGWVAALSQVLTRRVEMLSRRSSSIPQIASTFRYLVIDAQGQTFDVFFQVGVFQGFPQLLVTVLLERVEVHPQRSRKKHGVLFVRGKHKHADNDEEIKSHCTHDDSQYEG